MNGATFAPGMVGQAFSFDGVDDYVSIPQSANLPVRGTNSFTIDAWVNHQGTIGDSVNFNVFASTKYGILRKSDSDEASLLIFTLGLFGVVKIRSPLIDFLSPSSS
jgi:hypothetical protein